LLDANQKLSVLSAFRAQTIDAAWQVFQEDKSGSIEVEKIVYFAVLNRNPGDSLEYQPTQIRTVE